MKSHTWFQSIAATISSPSITKTLAKNNKKKYQSEKICEDKGLINRVSSSQTGNHAEINSLSDPSTPLPPSFIRYIQKPEEECSHKHDMPCIISSCTSYCTEHKHVYNTSSSYAMVLSVMYKKRHL